MNCGSRRPSRGLGGVRSGACTIQRDISSRFAGERSRAHRFLPGSEPRCHRLQANKSEAKPEGIDPRAPATLDSLNGVVQPAADALRAWRDVYQKCIVPGSLQTEEAKYLARTIKFLRKNKDALRDDQVELLTGAGMVWEVPSTVESKWWSNFHAAKAFLETEADPARIRDFLNHEMEDPHPFQEGTPDAVEASRWLGRQRVLYRRQKLTLMQVHLLKRVLPGVRLVRQRGKVRRNKHKVIRQADEEWLKNENL